MEQNDTLQSKTEENHSVFQESVVVNKSVSPPYGTEIPIQKSFISPDWYFFILLALMILLAWIRSVYGAILLKTYQATISFGATLRMFKDNSVLQKQLDQILLGLYFVSTALFLQIFEIKYSIYPYGLAGFQLFLFNVALLSAFYIVKSVMISITGFLFRQGKLLEEYRYNISMYNKLTGVIIIPLLLFILYTEGLLQNIMEWLSLGVIAGIILLRLYRGLIFSLKKDVLILYLFLYLCALEILPILVFFKWIVSII